MKKLIGISLMSLFLAVGTVAHAQDSEVKKDAKKVTKSVKKGAKKAGDKTAEVASKGKAQVTDAVHKDKVGPNNEKIYIDNHSQYYWVDDKGKRHYVKAEELKDKPKDD